MRPLVRPRHRWEDNIKINLQEVRWGSLEWIDLALTGKVASACECSD